MSSKGGEEEQTWHPQVQRMDYCSPSTRGPSTKLNLLLPLPTATAVWSNVPGLAAAFISGRPGSGGLDNLLANTHYLSLPPCPSGIRWVDPDAITMVDHVRIRTGLSRTDTPTIRLPPEVT